MKSLSIKIMKQIFSSRFFRIIFVCVGSTLIGALVGGIIASSFHIAGAYGATSMMSLRAAQIIGAQIGLVFGVILLLFVERQKKPQLKNWRIKIFYYTRYVLSRLLLIIFLFLMGGLIGTSIGGNFAVDFRYAGLMGYEAAGILGAQIGFVLGVLFAIYLIIRKMPQQ